MTTKKKELQFVPISDEIRLYFDIVPMPIQSFRYSPKSGGFQPKKQIAYKHSLKFQALKQLRENHKAFKLMEKYVVVKELIFSFKNLVNEKRVAPMLFKNTHSDIDNLQKGFFDAFPGVVYKNDGQICLIQNAAKLFNIYPSIVVTFQEFDYV